MTAVLPEIGLEILEALDFEPEHDCEHSNHGVAPWHSGPAAYLVRRLIGSCPKCNRQAVNDTFAICEPAWVHAGINGLHCPTCFNMAKRDDVWAIVGRL